MPTEPGVEARAARAVADRLAELIELERRIVALPDGWIAAAGDHPDAVALLERTRSTAAAHLEALEGRLAALGGDEPRERGEAPTAVTSASEALRRSTELLASAALACEIAYQTGRLGYAVKECNLLEALLGDLAALVEDARRVLPHAVARELRQSGVPCTCRCPMCSIGACGCIRATLVMTEEAWAAGAPSPEPGLSLLSPPRPGSQLEEAGLEAGDRILSADGVAVGSNDDLQDALLRHDVGAEALLEVQRLGGEVTRLKVLRIG